MEPGTGRRKSGCTELAEGPDAVSIEQPTILRRLLCRPGAGRDPGLRWIPAFAGMTRQRADAVPSV
jgi:hypothetical protein